MLYNVQISYEPPRGKTNNLHRRKQRRRSASQKLISLVFATRIVQFLFYLNLKFQASSSFLCLYRSVCVGTVRKPHCWFSHEAALIIKKKRKTKLGPDSILKLHKNIIICVHIILPWVALKSADISHCCVWCGFEPHTRHM